MTKKVKLRDVVIQRELVPLSVTDQALEVRGITAYDLMMALGQHGPAIAMAFGRIMVQVREGKSRGGSDMTNQELFQIVGDVIAAAPDLAGNLIALVMDEFHDEKAREMGRLLPLVDQLAILNAAAMLTLSSEATVKKLQEASVPLLRVVSQILSGARMTALTRSLKPTPSQNGTGKSGRT